MSIRLYVSCFIVLVLSLIGCSREAHRDATSASRITNPDDVNKASSSLASVSIVDRLGRTVSFVDVPMRIVSLSPATTELLFALGLGANVVGVTEHCNYPESALQVTKVGKGTLEGISREMIISVKPDLILCKWDNHQPLVETFERLNIPIVGLGPETLEELFEEAELIGRVTHRRSEASELVQSMRKRLSRITEAVKSIDRTKRAKVFYEVWDEPLMTAGPKSFIGELLDLANVENIFSDTITRYPRVSAEAVLERDPDVILAPTTHGEKVRFENIASRPGWDRIAAIRNKRVHLIDGDQVSRCGPRLLNALEQFVHSVYPGVLAPYDHSSDK